MSLEVEGGEFDILLVGIGGQGVLTIAELLAGAAMDAEMPVNYYPSKGVAQRGGFVKAQVRLGREPVGPNIPDRGADLVIALERSEALKAVRFVRPEGEFVLYDDVWAPTAVMMGQASYPSSEDVSGQVRSAGARLCHISPVQLPQFAGQPVSDNIFVLGVAVGQTRLRFVLDSDLVASLIAERWPKAAEGNLFAFSAGMALIPDA